MITDILIENFKAFGEDSELADEGPYFLRLAPVTLLFGSNSAGKSSFLHAFLYAYEVIVKGNRNPDATELGGRSVDLGGFETFVHKHELSRDIKIEFGLDLKSAKLDEEHPIAEFPVGSRDQIDLSTIGEDVWNARVSFTVSWDKKHKEPYVSAYEVSLNDDELAWVTCDGSQSKESQLKLNINHGLLTWPDDEGFASIGVLDWLYPRLRSPRQSTFLEAEVLDKENWEASVDDIVLAQLAEGDPPDELRFAYLTAEDGRDFIAVYELRFADPEVREFRFPRSAGWKSEKEARKAVWGDRPLFSPYIPSPVIPTIRMRTGPDALPDWDQSVNLVLLPDTDTDIEEAEVPEESSRSRHELLNDLVTRLVIVPGRLLSRALSQSRYIGPLREVPQRSHQAPLSPDPSRWSSGLAGWDTLATGDTALIETVSEWLSSKSRLGTGYNLIRRRFVELSTERDNYIMRILQQENPLDDLPIALEGLRDLPEKTRIVLQDVESLVEVEPQDIAVGLTQLVPVVVAAFDGHNGISMIEQPELHNHPSVEVGLGDLFIEAIEDGQQHCRFLLETHGEHLILRILRRIRETAEGELPDGVKGLSPEDVAVYYVQRTAHGVKVTHHRIDETGEFIDKWPGGFFRERAEELF